jgi:hypothetical protein
LGGFKRVAEAFRVPGQGNHGGSGNNRSKRSKTSVPAVMKRLGSAEEAEGRPGEQVSERNCFFPQRWRLRNAFGTLYAARRSFQSAGARKSRRVAHSGFYSDPAEHNRRDVACGGSQGAPGWLMAVFPRSRRLRNAFGTLYAARRSIQSAGARKSRRVAHSGFYSDPAGHNRRDVACGGSQGAPGWPMAVFPRSRRLGGVFMTLCAAPGRVWSAGASKSP